MDLNNVGKKVEDKVLATAAPAEKEVDGFFQGFVDSKWTVFMLGGVAGGLVLFLGVWTKLVTLSC